MPNLTTRIAIGMTSASVRRPGLTILIALALIGFFASQASRLVKEVGYSAYFGRGDPRVERVVEFYKEFQVGMQLLVVFGCQESPHCERIDEEWTLGFIGRLHSAIQALPNILNTTSVLNTPIVVGPLETRTLAAASKDGSWELAPEWPTLLERGRSQGLMLGTVLSDDGQTAGLVVELQSIDSTPLRATVHSLFGLLEQFEDELGAELYMAGEPIRSVVSSDMLDHDSLVATVCIFIIMLIVLWMLFRDPWMTLLPMAAIGPLFVAVRGMTAVLGIPVTLLLSIIPPLVLVIALTASIHFLTSFLRCSEAALTQPLVAAAEEVGAGCFWAAATTVVGFGTFISSELASFRDVGLLGSIGCMLAFLTTFTLLPALMTLRAQRGGWQPARKRTHITTELLAATFNAVSRHSRLVLGASLLSLLLLAGGMVHLFYSSDLGFGERSFVIRSFRFIEANLRKSEILDISVQIPQGSRIYDESSLRLLADVEGVLARDAYAGRVWSFLDLLEEAYRMDRGNAAPSLDELIRSSRRATSLAASFEQRKAFWTETITEEPSGELREADRARVAANHGFVGSEIIPYTARMRALVKELQQRWAPLGYEIELEGGTVLLDLFLTGLRSTQWRTFGAAFAIVASILALLVRRGGPALLFWAIAANLLPVLAVLGVMGWAGIGIDPANVMLGAILLALVVDDTIHMTLRYQRERARGQSVQAALGTCFSTVGDAILTSSLCLSLGCCGMLAAEWGGLAYFGLLASVGVALALAGDLLLLPAGLLVATRLTPKDQ